MRKHIPSILAALSLLQGGAGYPRNQNVGKGDHTVKLSKKLYPF